MAWRQTSSPSAVSWFLYKIELYKGAPLFDGDNELDQLAKIIAVLGTPPKIWLEGYLAAERLGINFPKRTKTPLSMILP